VSGIPKDDILLINGFRFGLDKQFETIVKRVTMKTECVAFLVISQEPKIVTREFIPHAIVRAGGDPVATSTIFSDDRPTATLLWELTTFGLGR